MKAFLKWLGIGFMFLVLTVLIVLSLDFFLPAGWKFGYEVLVGLAGVLLSAAFTYWPGLRKEFAGLKSEHKQLVNLVLIVVLSAVMFTFNCTHFVLIPGLDCTTEGIKPLLMYLFLAAGGNQLTYKFSVQTSDVKSAIAERDAAQG